MLYSNNTQTNTREKIMQTIEVAWEKWLSLDMSYRLVLLTLDIDGHIRLQVTDQNLNVLQSSS